MLRDLFGERIAKALTPKVVNDLDKSISNFVDRNSEILMTFDLSVRYSFADADRAVIYNAIGISEAEFTAAVKASKQIYSGNKVQSNPFYLASFLVARYFLSQKNPDVKHAKQVLTYMSLMMYTSIHKGLFKYNANKEIMDYTLTHLNKNFLIRQMASLFAFIEDNVNTIIDTYKPRILKADDSDLAYVTDATWVRTRSKLQKIAQQYYKNHREGNYLNADTDVYTDDEFREIDNNSFVIDRLVNKT